MNRLKEFRESLNLSVDEFSKIFSIHRSSLYRYEGTNKTEPRDIPIELAVQISEKFNISLDWLVGKDVSKYMDQAPNKLTEILEKLSEEGKKELFNFAMYILTKEGKS